MFLIISLKCWRYFVNVTLMAISPAPEKAIPGTRLLASQAILAAGGLIHRAGCAETILLFANHRHFLHDNQDWSGAINQLRRHAPEKKIVVEADTPKEAIAALRAQPDVLQLDKFSPQQATEIAQIAPSLAPHCTLALTGGINLTTLKNYLDCGIRLLLPPRLITRHQLTLKSVCNPQPLFNSLLNGIYSMRLKNVISAQHYHLPLPSRP